MKQEKRHLGPIQCPKFGENFAFQPNNFGKMLKMWNSTFSKFPGVLRRLQDLYIKVCNQSRWVRIEIGPHSRNVTRRHLCKFSLPHASLMPTLVAVIRTADGKWQNIYLHSNQNCQAATVLVWNVDSTVERGQIQLFKVSDLIHDPKTEKLASGLCGGGMWHATCLKAVDIPKN